MPRKTEDMTRYQREYKARRRGTLPWKSIAEDAAVLVAWARGELSEGQAARTLGCDRVEARERLWRAIEAGMARAKDPGPIRAGPRFEAFQVDVNMAGVGC